jgi:hypothetical protein
LAPIVVATASNRKKCVDIFWPCVTAILFTDFGRGRIRVDEADRFKPMQTFVIFACVTYGMIRVHNWHDSSSRLCLAAVIVDRFKPMQICCIFILDRFGSWLA